MNTPQPQSAFGTPKRRMTLRARWRATKPARPPGHREVPVLVRLDPLPGVTPSGKPAVRIFVGSEPEQYRAERVFIWSVLQTRDPARAYELYLMKDLVGYDRSKWTTGFTNYRYAIPFLAGGRGRAIYNDVDQIYLSDPAALFDADMKGAALLAINEQETSVMLMDCARLAALWDLDEVKRRHDHRYFRGAVLNSGAWGRLPGVWNARDFEYQAGESKLLHYTTLYQQPWQPFPEEYRYRRNSLGHLWHALEQSADEAGYTVFSAERPSPAFLALRQRGQAAGTGPDAATLSWHAGKIAAAAAAAKAGRLLELGDSGLAASLPRGLVQARLPLPLDGGGIGEVPGEPVDGACAIAGLEDLPEEDIPWVLDSLFRRANKFVYIAAAAYDVEAATAGLRKGIGTRMPRKWWLGQLRLAAQRHPGKVWFLALRQAGRDGRPAAAWRLFRAGRR